MPKKDEKNEEYPCSECDHVAKSFIGLVIHFAINHLKMKWSGKK